jgi:hypothetical protein
MHNSPPEGDGIKLIEAPLWITLWLSTNTMRLVLK